MSFYVEAKTVYHVIDSNTDIPIAKYISLETEAEKIAAALNANPDLIMTKDGVDWFELK